MEAPGLTETVQLANVFTNFLSEVMKLGIEGTGLVFRGGESIAKGSYVILKMAKNEYDKHLKDPDYFHRGSYSMTNMIRICSKKNVSPNIMRIKNDEASIAQFEEYARKNKLAYSIMPDLNVHDDYIELMYPSTQAIQYQNFMNNINQKRAFGITMEEYISNATPDKQQEMQSIIDNLSEEEKQLIKDGTEKAEKGEVTPDNNAPEVYDKEISISNEQLLKKEDGTAIIVLCDDENRECRMTVPETALAQNDYGYTVRLNGSEKLEYPDNIVISLDKSDITKEINGQYVVAVPNTHGEVFTSFETRNCKVDGNKITAFVNSAEKYPLLDKNFSFQKEITGKELYKGHFDSRLISSEDIDRFNSNYQKNNKINIPKADQQNNNLIVEVSPQHIKDIPGSNNVMITTTQGSAQVDKKCFISSLDKMGTPRTFVELKKGALIQAGNKTMSVEEFAGAIRTDRAKQVTGPKQGNDQIEQTQHHKRKGR